MGIKCLNNYYKRFNVNGYFKENVIGVECDFKVKIGISKNKGGKIEEVSEIKVIAGKGIVNDRYFKHENSKLSQITIIELENINYYNRLFLF